MSVQNFAVKLCGILQSQSTNEITAREWRLIGQEQDGSQLLTWKSTDANNKDVLNIGIYTNKTKNLTLLHTFTEILNIIQASVNSTQTLLVYVVKTFSNNSETENECWYTPYFLPLMPDTNSEPLKVEEKSSNQVMVQYIYGKSYKYSPGTRDDRFLLFRHLECIKVYRTSLICEECDDGAEEWAFSGDLPEPETIVKVFSWAQWDCVNQVLYYIYYRQPVQSFAECEEVKSPSEVTPTLSALQFHADQPHETVLNIPLSLPQLPGSGSGPVCGQYEDDPIPLRIHDCSLDLQIVCEPSGMVCICHHYLYKPLDDSTSSLVLEENGDLRDSGVNFAYSITLLHHGCVVHSVVPDLPWSLAKSLRPSYTLYGDNHLLVNIPMLFTHLLDVGFDHEPCCHVVLASEECDGGRSLAPVAGWGPNAMVDWGTLDVVTLAVTDRDLVAAFKSGTAVENKMAVIHYLLQHDNNMELAEELMAWSCVHAGAGYGALGRVMREFLVGAAHAATRRALAAAALGLAALLPFTHDAKLVDVKVGEVCVSVSQEQVWNSAAVVLAPRARVSQFAEDTWTRLWARLNRAPPRRRLRCGQVLDKLRMSLSCYQPEALSRCSTPLSPSGGAGAGPLGGGAVGVAGAGPRRASLALADALPFFEFDVCTASKQEHVIAANLREVSVHLMQGRAGAGAEGAVHAVGTRWAAAQLEASRALCRCAARAAAATPLSNQHRGFTFIDDMESTHAQLLFSLLEQYYLAADSIAFPLPQGFTSFFTYLGYRVLPFATFLQYVHRNVFELQIDVMKAIIAVKDTDARVVDNKLRLVQLVGEGRARRALARWPHRAATLARARDHAAALLAGTAAPHQHRARTGMTTLPSGERLSPLDTFLDLLTAKASLNELDFNLIIEATLALLQENQ